MKSVPVAAIDLGSNTVRLLVASLNSGVLTRHIVLQEVTRLGEGLSPGTRLKPAAVQRTVEVLEKFIHAAGKNGADRILVGATMAVRQASDGPEFMERISRDMNVETMILSGSREAELTACGVLTVIDPRPETVLIFDLGGRSTEFALAVGDQVRETISLPIGVVGLTEAYVTGDPPSRREVEAMCLATRQLLTANVNDLLPDRDISTPVFLVGTAGTTTTLAAIAQDMRTYRPERINNYRLSRPVLDGIIERLLAATTTERACVPGLPADRADVIVAGSLVVMEIMKYFNANHLIVSDAGLLEGIWLAAAGQGSLN